jgi:hypothetical protein
MAKRCYHFPFGGRDITTTVTLRLICHSMSYNLICSSKEIPFSAHDDIMNSKQNLQFPADYILQYVSESH